MPLSMTPGSSIIASPELRCRHGLRRDLSSSALPILPQSVSRGARISGLPVAGYDYNSDWTPLLAGLSPARMAASLAAPEPYVRLCRIRLPPRVWDGKAFARPRKENDR